MADHLVAVARIEQPLGERHADRIAEPLPERAGGRLDAGRVAIFRVAGRLRPELAEALELFDGHARVAREMEQRVEQHRAVASRQHESVAVRPFGVGGIEFEESGEQHRGHIGHAHRHAGMAGIRLLHGVHGERADRVRQVGVASFGQRPVLR